jgi:hypothetical protein
MLIFILFFYAGAILFKDDSEIIFVFILSCTYVPMLFFVWGIYRQRKSMWVKGINLENDMVIRVIVNVLAYEKMTYRRLSNDGPITRFPLKPQTFHRSSSGGAVECLGCK